MAFPTEMIDQARANNWIYSILAVIGVSSSIYLALQPSVNAEIGFGIAAVLISIFALVKEHSSMNEEKRRMRIA